MPIISLEDLEVQDMNKDYEESNVKKLDLLSNSIDRDLNTLDSISNLDLLIMNLDKAKEQLDLNKITVKELQEVLHNTSLTISHVLKVLTNGNINKITKHISSTITVEDINYHPLIALEEQKGTLKRIKDGIKSVNIKELKQTLIRKFEYFFKTLEKEYLFYNKKSKELIDFYKKNKGYFTLKENHEFSSETDLILSGFLDIVIKNYSTYIKGYEDLKDMSREKICKLSNLNLEFDLTSYKDIDFIKAHSSDKDTSSYYPLALNLGITKNKINTEVISLNHGTLSALLFGITDENDLKKLKLDYSSVYVRTSSILKIKEIDQIDNLLESSQKDMIRHYSIYSKVANDHQPYIITLYDFFTKLILCVAQKVISSLPGIPFSGFFSKLSTGLTKLYRNQNIYGNVYRAQRELISCLKVKDDIKDEKLKKELNEKLQKVINGNLN